MLRRLPKTMDTPIVCSLVAERVEAARVGTHTLHRPGGSVAVCADSKHDVALWQTV